MDIALSTPTRLPLERFCLLDSHDLDETREFVGRVFCPHGLSTLQRGRQLDARHHSVPLHRDASLNYVQYGAGVRIEPGYLSQFYLLQIPLRGGAWVQCGGQRVESHPLLASLPSPTEPLSMQWHEDSPQLIVKLDREAMRARLEALLQTPVHQPLVFDLGVDLRAPALDGVAGFIAYLRTALDTNAFFLGHKLLAEQAENHLFSSFLLSMQHNYSPALSAATGPHSRGGTVLPRAAKRAQEFMGAHAELPITLADVCAHVGISARALQQTFQQYTGASPMAFLRDLRLDRVHAELRAPRQAQAPACTPKVAEIAARYGFFHLGHFAAHYRRRFGETPTKTRQHTR